MPRRGRGALRGGDWQRNGIGRGYIPKNYQNGYTQHPANGDSAEPDSLTNFFNFASMPVPDIPTPPDRESMINPVASVSSDESWNASTPPKTADDNKEYVHRYLQLMENQLSKLKLQHKLKQGNRNFDESVIGTLPPTPHNGPNEVWKFDMNQRQVDTSHLLINSCKDRLLTMLGSRQVIIIEGFTGCGKTTQVPQFILDDAIQHKRNVRIAVTQPRRIAAMSVANRVCHERNWQLGTLVGYQVGMDRKSTEDTHLTYMTTGVLKQLLISKKDLRDYTHIIIDEVHERDLETDLLLLIIKKLMIEKQDSETKILLMSATLNAKKFLRYFPYWRDTFELNNTGMIKVTQPSLHRITEHYLDTLSAEYGLDGFSMDGSEEPRVYQECYDLACKIIDGLDFVEYANERLSGSHHHKFSAEKKAKLLKTAPRDRDRGAVLVFLPGLMEIDTMFKQLNELSAAKAGNSDQADVAKWLLLPLHSSITSEEQQKVFLPARDGFRKIILATNIAESSITVPDIKYVIDFCLTKSMSCDPSTNYTCLRLEWASKNQCIQRRGRCGRVSAGYVFRVVSKDFYENLQQEALPEMEKASLESVVLNVKLLEMGCPLEILALAIDPPKQSGIGRAVANLKEVGALTLMVGSQYEAYDGDLTFMGRVMAKLPIDIRLGRLIMLGYVYGVLEDVIIIAAGLSTKSPFSSPFTKRLEAYLSKLGWSGRTYSDCFALLNAFTKWTERHRDNAFRTFGEEKNWSRSYFLQISVLRDIGALVDDIKKRLTNIGIEPFKLPQQLSGLERGLIVKLVLAGACYPNYFTRSRPNKKEYEKEILREVGGFQPLNSVVFQGFPIEQPGKLYAKHIAEELTQHNSIPTIQFHASKVIVTFDSRGEKIGSVSYGVYRAVKMRQLRQKISFLTLGRDDARSALAQANDYYNRHPVLDAPTTKFLPLIQENEFECVLCDVRNLQKFESPTEFWIMRCEDEDKLNQIKDILSDNSEVITPATLDEYQLGILCVTVYKGERHRVRVDCVKADEALVFFIDSGLSVWRPLKQLFNVNPRMLREGLHQIPALAMQCRLTGIKPSANSGSVWYPEVLKAFFDFVTDADNIFLVKVYSVVEGVIAGDLFSPKLEESAVDRLLGNGHAEKEAESRLANENNDARRLWKILKYEDNVIKAFNEKQTCGWQPQRLLVPPRLTPDVGSLVTLRGPNSPLEMQFNSLCRSAHLKQVQVAGDSVNCVTLDQEPLNPCSRLLVAANVAIAHRSGNIMAKETTMMPPVPGIASLLTMVFCPKLEFRIDEQQTRYTGCVSGLGIDPIDGDPVYPDHDMELIFDILVDNEDLQLVNSIRMSMNSLMKEISPSDRTAQELREKLRGDIISLLQRNRTPIEETWPDQTHVWNLLQAVEKFETVTEAEPCATDVFPLHEGVVLYPTNDMEPAQPKNIFQVPLHF